MLVQVEKAGTDINQIINNCTLPHMKYTDIINGLTPWAPIGGKPPGLGIDPSSGLFAGDGARAPFG